MHAALHCIVIATAGCLLTLAVRSASVFFCQHSLSVCLQAAQALEPAALVPLQLLAPGGQVVLVGDPKQLPPTVLSWAAEAGNLAQSLFERLQQVCLYISAPSASSPWGAALPLPQSRPALYFIRLGFFIIHFYFIIFVFFRLVIKIYSNLLFSLLHSIMSCKTSVLDLFQCLVSPQRM